MLWLRAEDVVADDNGLVKQWKAEVGPSLTVSSKALPGGQQACTAPTLIKDNLPAVWFNGTNNNLSAKSFFNQKIGSSAFSIFMVSRAKDPRFGLCGNIMNGNPDLPRLFMLRTGIYYNLNEVTSIATKPDALEISEFFYDGKGTVETYRNGQAQAKKTVQPASNYGQEGSLAIPFLSGGKGAAGALYELIIFKDCLSEAKRIEVEQYLSAKYLETPVVKTDASEDKK
jgi:hypothetical protein